MSLDMERWRGNLATSSTPKQNGGAHVIRLSVGGFVKRERVGMMSVGLVAR
jgi:hypothetical protein